MADFRFLILDFRLMAPPRQMRLKTVAPPIENRESKIENSFNKSPVHSFIRQQVALKTLMTQ
jgi:hypothetical protein